MSSVLSWEQKFAAIQSLVRFSGDVNLRMRAPGDWYVHDGSIEVKERAMLVSATERGATPQDAVLQHWEALTKPGAVVVVDAMDRERRREYRWSGYMWQEVPR